MAQAAAQSCCFQKLCKIWLGRERRQKPGRRCKQAEQLKVPANCGLNAGFQLQSVLLGAVANKMLSTGLWEMSPNRDGVRWCPQEIMVQKMVIGTGDGVHKYSLSRVRRWCIPGAAGGGPCTGSAL